MPYCKQGLCMNVTDNGYCDAHGGLERQMREWNARDAADEARSQAKDIKPKGQAAPAGKGLSQFTSSVTREAKRDAKRKKRAEKEKAKKAARLARGPKKPKKNNKKGNNDGDGKGKKGKPDKSARKNARHGAVPAQQQTPNPPAPVTTETAKE